MRSSSYLAGAEQTALASDPSGITTPLSTETLFWRARFLRESPDLHYLPFLFWLVEVTRPRFVVELGMGSGVSHFATCQALDKLVPHSRCDGIDNWEANTVPTDIRDYNNQHYKEFSTIRRGGPKNHVGRYKDGSIDILHVNLPVDKDLLTCLRDDWRSKMSAQGVVVLHGLSTNFKSDDGRAFVSELESAYPTIRLENGDGLAAVLFGTRRSPPLMKMAELTIGMEGYSRVHNTLERLGTLHHYEWSYAEHSKKISYLRNKQTDLEDKEQQQRDRGDKLEKKLQEITAAYDERNKKIAIIQSEAFDHKTEFLEIKQDYLDLRARHEDQLRELDLRKQTANDLEEALQKAKAEIKGLKESHESQKSGLTQELEAVKGERDSFQKEAADLSRDAASLQEARDALASEKEEAEQQRQYLDELRQKLERDLAEVQSQNIELRSEADSTKVTYEAALTDLRQSKEQAAKDLEQISHRAESLENELADTKNENAALKATIETASRTHLEQVQALEAQLADAKATVQRLEIELVSRDEEQRVLTKSFEEQEASTQEQARLASERISEMTSALRDSERSRDAFEQELGELKTRYKTDLESRLSAHKAELNALLQGFETREDEFRQREDELKAQRAEQDARIKRLESDIQVRRKDLRVLTASLERQEEQSIAQAAQLKTELFERKEELTRLRTEVGLLSELRDEILSSTSWKMTAPARRIIDRLRGHSS